MMSIDQIFGEQGSNTYYLMDHSMIITTLLNIRIVCRTSRLRGLLKGNNKTRDINEAVYFSIMRYSPTRLISLLKLSALINLIRHLKLERSLIKAISR